LGYGRLGAGSCVEQLQDYLGRVVAGLDLRGATAGGCDGRQIPVPQFRPRLFCMVERTTKLIE
jgi:hypothetical protein